MANIKFHRSGGFAFNNVTVDNTNDIFLLDVVRNATPIKTRYDFIVPLRDGSQTFNNRYDNQYIDVVIAFYDVDIQTRRQKQRTLLSQFVDVESKLIFLDEPTLFYNAEVIDSIEVIEGEVFTEVTVHFKASHCKYELLDDLNEIIVNQMFTTVDALNILVNSLEHTNISALTNISINNQGNYEASPILIVTANTNCTSVTISNATNSFTLQNLVAGEQIYIDTEKMIAYKIVNAVKESVLTRFTGQFLKIPVGENAITVNGQSFNINLSIEYRNTFIV